MLQRYHPNQKGYWALPVGAPLSWSDAGPNASVSMPVLPGTTSPQLNCFKSELLKKPIISPPVKDFFNYGTVITYEFGRYNKKFL
jgi:hypothetical protein